MSTLYNRRRGAKSYRPRKPRYCLHGILVQTRNVEGYVIGETVTNPFERCPRLADSASRFCSDHRHATTAAARS